MLATRMQAPLAEENKAVTVQGWRRAQGLFSRLPVLRRWLLPKLLRARTSANLQHSVSDCIIAL